MLQLRLPPELHTKIKLLAEQEQRSLNGQIVYLLQRCTQDAPIADLAAQLGILAEALFRQAQEGEAGDDRR